jgi:superfamily II DNA or RNA helicase
MPPSLVLVGSRSLVKQTVDELSEWLGAPVGEVSSARIDLVPPVVVGLVQSLAAKSDEPWFKVLLNSRQVLMVDEVHHINNADRIRKSPSDGLFDNGPDKKIASCMWYEIAMACPAPNRYGLSATPLKVSDPCQNWRLIGSTGPVMQSSISSSSLIQKGFAARPYTIFVPFKSPRIPKKGNLFQDVVTQGIVNCYERNVVVSSAAKSLYDLGLKVLVLVERLDHVKILESMIGSMNLPCRSIDGTMNQEKQEEVLAWVKEPGERVLVSTRILGEGTNCPDIGAVVYAPGGKAFVRLYQSIGRCIRPKVGRPNVCIVVVPDDRHNVWLADHVEQLRLHLAAEEGYRVAEPGQSVEEFAKAVLDGAAKVEVERGDDEDEQGPVP